jgi:TubC N-terminal docking domain
MTAESVLLDLSRRGIKLIPDGDALLVQPASRITDSDRAAIRAAKSELLELLAAASLHDREEDEVERIARVGWSPSAEIPTAIASQIKRIESQAFALGWRSERLWNFQFWPDRGGQPRGLASVMDPGDRVVEITREFVLIEKSNSRRDRLRFWRTDG